MKRNKWYLALIITSLIFSAGLAGGCMLPTSPQGTASQSASTTNTGDTSNSSPEAIATSPVTVTDTPSDETQVGSDPVSGQSQEVNLNWEQLCLSSEYQVQIAKDPGFTIIVLDTGAFAPADSMSPAAYYPAGGRASSPSALTPWANLESGHTYYLRVRVRQAATGQHMLSPWSEVKSITIESGLPASSPSYGLQPVYPNNGGINCPVKSASLAWSPLKDTTKYRFVLAKDAAMTQVVKEAEVTTTAYEYDGQLEYGQSYFWKVMALEPAPSDWSATFSFQTEAAPLPPAEPAPQPETPLWAWVVIAIGLALLIVIIVFVFRARRR
jgi:hypothetical protein